MGLRWASCPPWGPRIILSTKAERRYFLSILAVKRNAAANEDSLVGVRCFYHILANDKNYIFLGKSIHYKSSNFYNFGQLISYIFKGQKQVQWCSIRLFFSQKVKRGRSHRTLSHWRWILKLNLFFAENKLRFYILSAKNAATYYNNSLIQQL